MPNSTKSNFNYIVVSEPPGAVFTANKTAGVVPLTVTFTNLSTNASSYVWDFGNGTTSTSTNKTVTNIVYAAVGNYTVTLKAINAGVTNVMTNIDYISVMGSPVAGFTAGPSTTM